MYSASNQRHSQDHNRNRSSPTSGQHDVEKAQIVNTDLINDTIQSFSWSAVSVRVKDRHSKSDKHILSKIDGSVKAGELLALMGPSGSGKTTLLNVLAQRTATAKATTEGTVLLDGKPTNWANLRRISSYVEQEDALIGSITVKETLNFAARLALPSSVSKADRLERINDLVQGFGLQGQANTLVGTPIRKGISGGQKRRLGVASQLITNPKILFLDEPTSGLDSAASYEVMSHIKSIAQRYRLIVIASIHQPSTTTYQLFDKLMLLSAGKTCYNGPAAEAQDYFGMIGFPTPTNYNPAEWFLNLVNTDFTVNNAEADRQLDHITTAWIDSGFAARQQQLSSVQASSIESSTPSPVSRPSILSTVLTLTHRSFVKSYRDVLAYGIRVAMYIGLAIMMGTVFLRLPTTQASIQPFINALFFGSAFMSFMAVAYVPAFLEDRSTFVKERNNGLYGPLAFNISNFLIGIPYLFLIALIFSIISYWLINFEPTARGFWTYLMWLFLDLIAAESLVVLISSIAPIFVVSLAVTAFANGLWMCVGGFLVPLGSLNVFWKYVFHYVDYQAYVFQGMMVNEFARRTYDCNAMQNAHGKTRYQCMYPSELSSSGKIPGIAVLTAYKYHDGLTGTWVGILIGIIAFYRIAAGLVMWLKRS